MASSPTKSLFVLHVNHLTLFYHRARVGFYRFSAIRLGFPRLSDIIVGFALCSQRSLLTWKDVPSMKPGAGWDKIISRIQPYQTHLLSPGRLNNSVVFFANRNIT